MEQTKTTLTKTWVVAALACVCCLLWGSAIPLIKTGYRLMQVDSADTASQIVFAGVRFALAGILVLIFASISERKVMIPDRTILKYAVPVCLAQTVCQYFFFYIGVAHTSGVKGAIITGLGNFIAILLSCFIFRKERMTGRKMIGCILGFAGVVVINLMGNSLDVGFKLTGEGFILIAQLQRFELAGRSSAGCHASSYGSVRQNNFCLNSRIASGINNFSPDYFFNGQICHFVSFLMVSQKGHPPCVSSAQRMEITMIYSLFS